MQRYEGKPVHAGISGGCGDRPASCAWLSRPCARASEDGEGRSQTILLARRTRTMKLCSSHARREGRSGHSLEGTTGEEGAQ